MDFEDRAEEWFAYQWARYIVGAKTNPQVKGAFKQFDKALIEPVLKKWASSEGTANSAELHTKIQNWLGVDYTGSPVDPVTPAPTPPVAEAPAPEVDTDPVTDSGSAKGSEHSEEKSAISKTLDALEIKARAQSPEPPTQDELEIREYQAKIDRQTDPALAAQMTKAGNWAAGYKAFFTPEENAAAQTRKNEKILRTRKASQGSEQEKEAARDSGYAASVDEDRAKLDSLVYDAQVTPIRPIAEGELKALEAWITEEREYEAELEKQKVEDSKKDAEERQGARAAKKEAAEKKGTPDLRLKEDEVGQKGPGPKSGVGSGDKVTGKSGEFPK